MGALIADCRAGRRDAAVDNAPDEVTAYTRPGWRPRLPVFVVDPTQPLSTTASTSCCMEYSMKSREFL